MNNERFVVAYRIAAGSESEARQRAVDLALEQTVEVGDALVPDGLIRDHVIGQIDNLQAVGTAYVAHVSYAVDSTAHELTQFLNVLFGNSSLKPGLRIVDVQPTAGMVAQWGGPRHGMAGLRRRVAAGARALLCTALKPMGLSATALADLAYRMALGGIDVIKDDHGLSDQPYAPFFERVERCAEAVERANRSTGLACVYAPNVTAPADRLLERARFARTHGAGALLVAPGLAGFDALRLLRQHEPDLPLLSHPAWLGSFVTSPDNGIDHRVLFGSLQRLAGADASIFPNSGGRFGFTPDECMAIVDGCRQPFAGLLPIAPTPGGGMSLQRLPEILERFGPDTLLLVGGALLAASNDLVDSSARLRRMLGD